jgi:protein tyrosine phosphatase
MQSFNLLLKISCQPKCYAPATYIEPVIEADCTPVNNVVKELTVSGYERFSDIQATELKNKCLDKNEHRDNKAVGISSTVDCKRRNRFTETYSYVGHSLNNESDNSYINSAKFSGRLVEKDGKYVYSEENAGSQGFIAATNAPLGDFRKMITEFSTIGRDRNFAVATVQCKTFDKESRVDRSDCFSGNLFNGGAFEKENTQLAFYRALKNNNIVNIVQLTNFAEEPVIPAPPKTPSPCFCKAKADRYFADLENTEQPLFDHEYKSTTAKVLTLSKTSPIEYNGSTEVRKLKFTDVNPQNTHKVTHYHYRSWQDFSVPTGKDLTGLYALIKFIRAELDAGRSTIVHCTGGIGRTGTFIAAVLTSKLKPNVKFDLFQFILKMREKRPDLVEAVPQVQLIIKNMLLTKLSRKFKK